MGAGSERRSILAGFALFMVTLWAVCGLWAWTERELTLRAAERHLSEVTTAVGEQTLGSMRLVRMSLSVADQWIREHPGQDPASSPGFQALAKATHDITQGLVDLRMVTREGGLRYVGDKPGTVRADVSDREYFQVQQDPALRGFHLGRPVKSRVTGRWGIPVSYPVGDERSSIAVLLGALELDRLSELHEKERHKPGGSISLIRADGVFLSRVPFDEEFMGRNLSGSPLFRNRVLVEDHGVFVSDGARLDGVERLVGFHRLAEYSLVVVVAARTSDLLAAWNKRVLFVAGIAVAATALAALVLRRLLGALRMSEQAQAVLARQANTDGLTGLLNRRAFLEASRRELERVWRTGRGFSLLMLDLDHFKEVNDSLGHAAGDVALRLLGQVLSRLLRGGDLAGRVGGEEFCVLLPEATAGRGAEVAERLRGEFAQATERAEGLARRVTLSVGVAEYGPQDMGLEDILLRADQALYRAKNAGRDRVERA